VAATATAGRTVFVNAEPSGDSSVANEGKLSSTVRQVHSEKNEPHLENELMESSVAASVSPQVSSNLCKISSNLCSFMQQIPSQK
jgi:hypothetical protein